ncbi:MAG: hypothetical protein VZS44_09405 [Bacilli bacterium]|nr:hypothetical protein [Bacilli bacterium]
MKVGEYCRTIKGISKIKKLAGQQNNINFYEVDENGIHHPENLLMHFVLENEIIKHSKKLIDLIEVSDYVNGSKVIDIAQAPVKALYTEDIKQTGALKPIINNEIESVLTHEQIKSMEYKVKV